MTLTWRELWIDTTSTLGGTPEAANEARWICQQAAGRDGAEWVTGLDDPVGMRAVARLDAMVERRRAGEPIQYVVGSWGFRRLDLMVDERVLIPRPETEIVVDVALELLASMPRPVTVVDLGTGSGAIGLALADETPLTGVTIWATDVSSDALDVARANLAGLGRPGTKVRLAQGSWFEALPEELRGQVDLLVSNPPYVASGADLPESVRAWEPAGALFAGPDGLDGVRAVVGGAAAWLRPGGAVAVEIGADQGGQAVALARAEGFEDVCVRADLAGHDRVLVLKVGEPSWMTR